MSQIEMKLEKLGLTIPNPPKPAANYAPFSIMQNFIVVSGQLPLIDGQPHFIGKVGRDFDLGHAQAAARICALNILSILKVAMNGNIDRVLRCVRLGGFVNATSDFTDHPKVMNGASDLMVDVFGEEGLHARAAVGCSSLPLGVAVEVEGTFEVRT